VVKVSNYGTHYADQSEIGVDLGITDQLQVRWNGVSNISKQIDGF
jgi:hypothetical protein